MKEFLGVTLFLMIVFVLFLIAPLILIASANTISEQANMGWYIPHNFWTYLSGYGLILTLKGSGKVSS